MAAVFAVTVNGTAQTTPAPPPSANIAPQDQAGGAKDDLRELVLRINSKLQKGLQTEADLAPELKQFDVLLDKYKGQKTEDVARIVFMKATLYSQIFHNFDKAAELFKQVAAEYPDTEAAKNTAQILDMLQTEAKAAKIQATLTPGSQFPDFNVTDTSGKPLSVADHKGKVLLVDFWATWCPPCRAELPNVIDTYKKYHDKGFDIIGVSLDEDKSKLLDFTKEQGMAWPQYYDGLKWSNKLVGKYGITSIPSTFLLDFQGRIITNGARGEELQAAVAKALAAGGGK